MIRPEFTYYHSMIDDQNPTQYDPRVVYIIHTAHYFHKHRCGGLNNDNQKQRLSH